MLSVALRHKLGAFSLDAEFEAPAGLTVLFGGSGSGKTSIINAVSGLLRPDQGRISIEGRVVFDHATGQNLPAHKRGIGYVFQEARLFPHLSVRQNLLFGARFAAARPWRLGNAAQFDHVVGMLGLEALLDRRPGALSGGEKQRVAIGRALLSRPRMILADEPLAALDGPRKEEILPYFERLRDEGDVPILYVSHAMQEVARLATSVVVIEGGRVLRQGAAHEVLVDPVLAARHADAGAVLSAVVVAHHDDGLSALAAGGATVFVPRIDQPIGHRVRLRVAAQDVMIAMAPPVGVSALNCVAAEVKSIRETSVASVVVELATPAGGILARITKRSCADLGLCVGVRCYAVLKTVAIEKFDIGSIP